MDTVALDKAAEMHLSEGASQTMIHGGGNRHELKRITFPRSPLPGGTEKLAGPSMLNDTNHGFDETMVHIR